MEVLCQIWKQDGNHLVTGQENMVDVAGQVRYWSLTSLNITQMISDKDDAFLQIQIQVK